MSASLWAEIKWVLRQHWNVAYGLGCLVYTLFWFWGSPFLLWDFVGWLGLLIVGVLAVRFGFHFIFALGWVGLEFVVLRRELLVVSLLPAVLLLLGWVFVDSLRRGWKYYGALVIVRLFGLLVLTEVYMAACYWGWIDSRWYWREERLGELFWTKEKIKTLGRVPKPGGQIRHVSYICQDKVDWDVEVNIDEQGMRQTPNQTDSKEMMVVLGCSFTFGYGLEDHQTTSSVIQSEFDTKVMNCGCNGYGPGKMLNVLKGRDYWPGFENLDGVTDVVYFFLPHHFYVNHFSKQWSHWRFPGHETWYDLEQGNLVESDQVEAPQQAQPPNLLFLYFLQHCRTLRILQTFRFKEDVEPKWIEMTARLTSEMKRVAQERWGARFHVVLLKSWDLPALRPEVDVYIKRLNDLNIEFLDLTHLLGTGYRQEDFDLTSGHYKPHYARLVGTIVAEYIKVRQAVGSLRTVN